MSLFSSFLCCSSDISSENINNSNNNNNNSTSPNNKKSSNHNSKTSNSHTNSNKTIKTVNKDYPKETTMKSSNKEMISGTKKSADINKAKNIATTTTTTNNNYNQNSNINKKSNNSDQIYSSKNNDVMLVDSNDADEEKEYDDSEDMDIDADDDDYKKKLDPNNDNSNASKEKQTINVYSNETDRSTGSSDYGYIQQQQIAEEAPQLTIVSSHEENNNNDSNNNTTSIPDINSNNASNNDTIVNNTQYINQPVISTTLSTLDTNTTSTSKNPPSPISNIDPNDINPTNTDYTAAVSNMNASDNMDYNMIQPFDETEEFVDLTMLQADQYHAPGFTTLLSPKDQSFKNKKLLVLDLDETLVHSSFKYLRSADFVLPVDIDDQIHNVYVIKRPGVDEFLQRVGEIYEVVVFTASVNRYGDPLLDILDKKNSIHHRLFREACYNYEGNYIKNLSQLGRPLSDIIILDNSPASYIFHPQHAIPVSSWFSDTHDNELLDIIPLLEDLAKKNVLDVGKVLDVSI